MFDVSLSNSGYSMYNVDNNILHNVDGALYPFNPDWKRVGVNLSGGADSAVGVATLCKLIQQSGADTEIVVLTNVRVWENRPWAAPISVEVYNKLREMFPDVQMQRVQGYIPPEIEDGTIGIIEQIGTSGDRITTRSFNKFAAYTYKLEAVYGFITNNPVADDFQHPGQPYDRTWNADILKDNGSCPQYKGNSTPIQVYPWKLISKEFIMGQYLRNNWQDLLNITRSCEGDKALHQYRDPNPFVDYTEYQHGVTPLPTCNDITDVTEEKCFWCNEREWALNKARKIIDES